MQDYSKPIDHRDLSSRLNSIQKSPSLPNNGDFVSPGMSRSDRVGTASSTSSSKSFPRLPRFKKSSTMSTTASDDSSRFEVMGTKSTASVYSHPVEVGQGEFSKPNYGGMESRKRRESNESRKSVPEFQYYGRHANTWLFNDFSITDSVKKGWGRVFSGKNSE